MRRALVVVALLAVSAPAWLAASAPAAADEGLTSTQASLLVGAGQNVGGLGDRYLYGFLAGTEAGFQIRPTTGSLVDFGGAWSFLWGYFPSSSDANVDAVLTVVQLEGVARTRVRLPGMLPAYLRGDVGMDFYRASVPVPPDGDQVYLGPTVGLGFEVSVAGYVISLGARYGVLGSGPAGLRLLFGIGMGSK